MIHKESKILITGAAGFIGSYMVGYLNRKGFENLVLVDEFDDEEKELNLHNKKFLVRVERDNLFEWLKLEEPGIDFFYHIGARTDTTEFNYAVFEKLNVGYSKQVWEYCTEKKIPLVYASSAATYGRGEHGYKDDHEILDKLKPLNPYGVSKNEFDKWTIKISRESGVRSRESGVRSRESGVRSRESTPPFWAGLKFFNVYGPNEYHKQRMASVVFHAFNQIQSTGEVKLFRSHKPEYKDGEQLRDFIYVEDVAAVCFWLLDHRPASSLYNLGTGRARTFNDLVNAIYKSLGKKSSIIYIDTPEDIRDKYQYFTEADMNKLRKAGYDAQFSSLEEGVGNYVREFLATGKYY